MLVPEALRLPTLTTVQHPGGRRRYCGAPPTAERVQHRDRRRVGGVSKGRAWRIGLMGHSARPGKRVGVAGRARAHAWPTKIAAIGVGGLLGSCQCARDRLAERLRIPGAAVDWPLLATPSGGAAGYRRVAQDDWPNVAVQLPVYNERHVIERLIDAAAALDYPRDRLEIQVLDDSRTRHGAGGEQEPTYHRAAWDVNVRVSSAARSERDTRPARWHGASARTDAEYRRRIRCRFPA